MSTKCVSALDLSATFAALMVLFWALCPLCFNHATSGLPWVVLAVLILLFHAAWFSPVYLHHDAPERHGLGSWRHGFLRVKEGMQSWLYFGMVTGIGLFVLLIWTLVFSPHKLAEIRWASFLFKAFSHLFSAAFQALFVFELFLPRALDLWRRPTAVCVVALLFSMLHLPNLPLMVLCFLGGIAWGWEYARRPNLIPLILSHALLAAYLSQILKLSFRCGPFYSHPQEFLLRELIPWWGIWANKLL